MLRPPITRSAIRVINQPCRSVLLRLPNFTRYASSTSAPSSLRISAPLLNRAQTLANEQAALKASQIDAYDSKQAQRIGQLQHIADALARYQSATSALEELEQIIASSGDSANPSSISDDAELVALAHDDIVPTTAALESAIKTLTTALIPLHPFTDHGAMLEIRPGAGGGEACIFAADLLDMYTAYARNRGLRAQVVRRTLLDSTGSSKGISEALLEVSSAGAYGRLRCEVGVHRVQRVPETEKSGRVHTSTVSVMVLPLVGGAVEVGDIHDPGSDYYVDVKDVKIDVMRSSGAGGQHVNKTESAVRLTHGPTNIVVGVSDERSQLKNREKAWGILRGKLAVRRREEREQKMLAMRRGVMAVNRVGREDKVRTYNWGQRRVSDHRSGVSTLRLDEVMTGGEELESIMEGVRAWMGEQELALAVDSDANL